MNETADVPLPTSDADIMANFPFETARDGQIDAIRFVLDSFNNGKKFVIIEAPCGAGKSAIALAVAKFFQTAYYITIQKILQDQLVGEFGENGKYGSALIDLKGRGAYECTYYKANADKLRNSKVISLKVWSDYKDKYHDCAEGHCRVKGKYKYDECIDNLLCPYYVQRDKAIEAQCCLMNFASFLHQTNFTDKFGRRDLLIIDEAHNTETQLLSFISLTINEDDIEGVKFPKYDTAGEYAVWIAEKSIELIITNQRDLAKLANDPKRADALESLRTKIMWFMKEITCDNPDPWVVEYMDGKLTFKPVYIRKQAHKYLFDIGTRVLMLSATILNVNVMARALDIPRDQLAAKRLGSRFPKENRPIYIKPVAKIVGGADKQGVWGPALVKGVEKLCRQYEGRKGIIHTHNSAIARMLVEKASGDVAHRLLYQGNFTNKGELLNEHRRRTDSIIVAPAMHEGLDLVEDLSRFQIICKVPFPNFHEDKQLAARKESDEQFYNWLVALKLVQSVGRSVRSETDWADTYILDESFKWWYRQNQDMLPTWFKESVIFG